MKRLWFLGLWIFFGVILSCPARARAEEEFPIPDLDYEEAQKALSAQLAGENFALEAYIRGILSGSENFSLDSLWAHIKKGLQKELAGNRNQLLSVLVIAVGAAIFTNFSNVFKNNQVADTSFYVAYLLIHLANHLMEKDLLSKTTELIEEGVGWGLKTMLGLVAGYNFIQGIIAPAADQLKKSGLIQAASVIPGIGNAVGSVAETVLGAGVLVKNAVGAGGILALLVLMAGPVLKLFLYMFFYRVGAALVQPVSDKRILECLLGAAKAAKLLLTTVCAGGALFLLTLAIVMSATNLRI